MNRFPGSIAYLFLNFPLLSFSFYLLMDSLYSALLLSEAPLPQEVPPVRKQDCDKVFLILVYLVLTVLFL